ncbi:MAG TPA: hypothetical protein VN029_04560, partial [Sphingomonas sp.]|nr:hypothetical protein [Sphingomonas sp.]
METANGWRYWPGMGNGTARVLLVVAQILPFATMAEMIVFHSLWLALPAFGAILLLGTVKCRHCGLPGWDKSVMGTR